MDLFTAEDLGGYASTSYGLNGQFDSAIACDNHALNCEDSFTTLDSFDYDASTLLPASSSASWYGQEILLINSNTGNLDNSVTTDTFYDESSDQGFSGSLPLSYERSLSIATVPKNSGAGLSTCLQDGRMSGQDLVPYPTSSINLPQQPLAASVARFVCPHPGCGKTFARHSDMIRHTKVHDPNAARFDCSIAGCSRKGRQGFARNDKRLAHERAHRRAIQKAQDKASRHG